jgi:hypothetical protein
MASFIESVLEQVKGDVTEALSPERIEQICRELNHVWRDCKGRKRCQEPY